jgi:NodT family efflux transporter outer membrane factor (OMF) lipoprotein
VKRLALIIAALAFTACANHVSYTPPAPQQVPPNFKENADWKTAQPADHFSRGAWWEVFGDEQLNTLQAKIDVSNETLKAQQARFAQARAAIGITRADKYPQVTVSPSITATESSANRANAIAHQRFSDFVLPVDVSYEADVWNRVRNSVTAAQATAQASATDLESVRLSLHAELALDYFELRGIEADRQILAAAVTAFQRALDLTRSRFQGGIASQADVAQAETQLETTRAEAKDLMVRRAALEHAIAALVGQPASSFALTVAPLSGLPPEIPAGLPGDLLERRPDIAGAERRVASANASLGVARAAFFPRLLLTASAGFESSSLANWLTGLSSFWSVGPAAVATIFDGGRRRATSAQAQASYEEMVADYQNAVLTAFQEVEDNLAALRVLREEADIQQGAVAAADRSLTLANNRYRGGVASYLEVTTAQNAALSSQRIAADILSRRLSASVLLIKALGGGWNAALLPELKGDGR